MTIPKAILFDTFGTVVDWRGSLIALGEAFRPGADWAGLADAWRAAYAPTMQAVRRGERPWARLEVLQRESLAGLAPRFGLALTPKELDVVNGFWRRLQPWPDAVPGLKRLREHCIIGPLSNGDTALLVGMARGAGLPWDTVLGSDVFGHFKPDPETYLGACRLLALAPGEVMLCAAHNGDLAAAQPHGMLTAFVVRPTEHGPGQTTDLRPEGDWTYSVDSIDALADCLSKASASF